MPRNELPAPMIILVLPAYNEEASLGNLLSRVVETQPTLPVPLLVLLVDDGSTDGTAAVAEGFRERLRIEIVRHGGNRGLGASIKTGLSAALAHSTDDHDLIITMDADDTHSPGLFTRMLQCSREGYHVVIASRYVPDARIRGLSMLRKVFSSGARLLFCLALPMEGVRDYTCGYRAYQAGMLRRVWERYGETITTGSGFACMAEILLTYRPFRPLVIELPLILRYDRKGGASKLPVQRTVAYTLRLIGRTWLRELEGWLARRHG